MVNNRRPEEVTEPQQTHTNSWNDSSETPNAYNLRTVLSVWLLVENVGKLGDPLVIARYPGHPLEER